MKGTPTVSIAEAPAGTEKLGANWITVDVPDIGLLIAAVARPAGDGPFPTVLLLHGSHGFALEYVRLAQDLARFGLLSIAGCWFREGGGAGQRFVTPVVWTKAPRAPDPMSDQAFQTVSALVHASRNLGDAHPDRFGLFGHSRGGGAVLSYMLRAGDVQAGVLSSSRYPRQLTDIAHQMTTPVLMLHGTADDPADGGTEFTSVEMARNFERALRSTGKPVDAVYYEDGRHNDIFARTTRYQDELKQMSAFYRRHLGPIVGVE